MAVLVVARMNGTAADADEWHERNKALKQHQGFIFQADGPAAEGWQVISAWESRDDFQKYFDTTVKPTIPAGVDPQASMEIHELASFVK